MSEEPAVDPAAGLEAVAAMMDGAAEPPPETPPETPDDEGGDGDDDGDDGGHLAVPENKLPPDCPVVPLGLNGDVYYFMDERRQLRAVEDAKLGRLKIISLFGTRKNLIYQYWGKTNKDRRIVGWQPERAQEALMYGAANAGVWDPFQRVRGRGAWIGDRGELIYHCGSDLIVFAAKPGEDGTLDAPTRCRPGPRDRFVYPSAPPGPEPAKDPAAYGPDDPVRDLLSVLATWNWKREIDPILAVGWIGAAMLGGALHWRPATWITGGKGTGKSYLQKLINLLLDDDLVDVAEPTAAGIWQKLQYSSRPVYIDEAEGEEDPRKLNTLVKLARLAASGGVILRGGADHKAAEFQARSCFLLSSIVVPSLLPQDRSRIAILELGRLSGGPAPTLDVERWRAAGAAIRRRMADGWPRFERVLVQYRAALEREGHDSRGADQFGTLLACADILMHPAEEAAAEADERALQLKAADLIDVGDADEDERACLDHILDKVVDPYRHGLRLPLKHWVARATGFLTSVSSDKAVREAQQALTLYGLKVVYHAPLKGGEEEPYLAIANKHTELATLLQGTQWSARSGAQGAWVHALRRLPGAEPSGKAIWFGQASKATIVPLSLIFSPNTDWKALSDELEGTEMASQPGFGEG